MKSSILVAALALSLGAAPSIASARGGGDAAKVLAGAGTGGLIGAVVGGGAGAVRGAVKLVKQPVRTALWAAGAFGAYKLGMHPDHLPLVSAIKPAWFAAAVAGIGLRG